MNRPRGEHGAALDFLSREQHGRPRRNSISQTNTIHNAPTMEAMAPQRAFSAAQMENLRRQNGNINASELIGMMHPQQERNWNPNLGQGRRQIRTGRNFQVPDSQNPGHHFTVRIHTNDNTINDRNANAYSNAVVRIQRSVDGRFLMGGNSHRDAVGANAWAPNRANDAQINAAHIPVGPGRRR